MRNSAGQGRREREGLEEEKMPTIGIWPIGEGLAMGGEGRAEHGQGAGKSTSSQRKPGLPHTG